MAAGEQAGPGIGRASADDRQILRAMFSRMLARAAGSRNREPARDALMGLGAPPGERERFDRFYEIHDRLTADLRGSRDRSWGAMAATSLFRHHTDHAVACLYPEFAGDKGAEWRAIVCEEVEKLIRDRVMPDIDRRFSAVCSSCRPARPGAAINTPAGGILDEVGTRLSAALCDGAELGTALSRALNDRFRHLPFSAEGQRFIGIREAETILESMGAV